MDLADGGGIALNAVIFLVSLAFCALFSFLETAMVAMRLFQLKELAQKKSGYDTLFATLEKDPNRLLNAILISYNLANTLAATAGTFVIEELLKGIPSSLGYAIGVFVVTALILIVGDVLPKNIVRMRGERYFESTLWLTNLVLVVLNPFVKLFNRFTNWILSFIVGQSAEEVEELPSEKEVQFLISYIDEKGLMDPDKTSMLKSIFDLSSTVVRDIMVPEVDVIMVEAEQGFIAAHELFTKYQFSRFPVYRGKDDNVIGMLHFKDLVPVLAQRSDAQVQDIMRPIMFVPESMKINQLLKELKAKHMHIAMVINEHGMVTGMVTLEDVLEEIVGEIHDEYENVSEKIYEIRAGAWLAEGNIELKELSRWLSISLNAESSVKTLGGFLIEQFQRIPLVGEYLDYQGFRFKVQQATPKKVLQVVINRITAE
ncbi:TPA: hypothetical protein DCW54_01760 [Candidatus Dependentiae bacterium]|nr:hypothetical protein [Candidatus Dependentiae bacterium]